MKFSEIEISFDNFKVFLHFCAFLFTFVLAFFAFFGLFMNVVNNFSEPFYSHLNVDNFFILLMGLSATIFLGNVFIQRQFLFENPLNIILFPLLLFSVVASAVSKPIIYAIITLIYAFYLIYFSLLTRGATEKYK